MLQVMLAARDRGNIMTKPIEHHDVNSLASAVGIPIIVTLSGASGPMEISRWRNGDIVPTVEQSEKLSCALEILTKIRRVKGLPRARAWFISLSVGEDMDQPAIAILDGRFTEVYAAANELIGSRS
jgi:hypothetical protein